MLSKIEITTERGELLVLPFMDSSEGYLVKDVEGLDPVKATFSSSSYAQQDGDQHQSSRLPSRNIILKMDALLGYGRTIRELRKRLYGFLMPQSLVTMRFYMVDEEPLDIVGRVESFDWPIFVQEPDISISLICDKPAFISLTPVTLAGASVADDTESLFHYEGDSPTGFVFQITVDRSVPTFDIFLRSEDSTTQALEFDEPLIAGDMLTISTVPGDKGATLTRDGAESSLVYGVTPESDWISLHPGDNMMRVYTDGAPLQYTVTYTARYGGL